MSWAGLRRVLPIAVIVGIVAALIEAFSPEWFAVGIASAVSVGLLYAIWTKDTL